MQNENGVGSAAASNDVTISTSGAPVITGQAGGVSEASVTFDPSPTATTYTVVPVRVELDGSTLTRFPPLAVTVPDAGAGTSLTATVALGASNRGLWRLEVKATNSNGVDSAPNLSAAVVVGTPLAPFGSTAVGATAQATLTFRCVRVWAVGDKGRGVRWWRGSDKGATAQRRHVPACCTPGPTVPTL